jgi:hypothetical protein
MSLVTYQETRPWAKAIKERVIQRQMPPWHIDRNVGVQRFKNDISLTDEQINTIARWVDSGAPLGDPKICHLPFTGRRTMTGERRRALGGHLIVKSEPYTMAAHLRTCGGGRFRIFR